MPYDNEQNLTSIQKAEKIEKECYKIKYARKALQIILDIQVPAHALVEEIEEEGEMVSKTTQVAATTKMPQEHGADIPDVGQTYSREARQVKYEKIITDAQEAIHSF